MSTTQTTPTVDSLEQELASLGTTNELVTSALVEANDQLLGLYALARFAADADETTTLIERLANEVRKLAGASAVAIVAPDGHRVLVGNTDAADRIAAHLNDTSDEGLCPAATTGEPFDMILRGTSGDKHGLALAGQPDRAFRSPQVKLVEALFAQIDGFIGLATMHQQALAHALVERDAAAASEIAGHALPQKFPELQGIEVAARCDPARLGGGDFYTWVETPDGLVFALGDVAGKGLPAAIVMTLMCESIRAAVVRKPDIDPSQLLTGINSDHAEYLTRTGLFVTLVVGDWCAETNRVRIGNAGHSPVCVWNGTSLEDIYPSTPPVGVLDDIAPEIVEFDLGLGHMVVLGTDGLVEQEDEHGHQIGYDGFADMVTKTAFQPAQQTIDHLFTTVEDHGGDNQDDDRTALIVRRLPTFDGIEPCMN